MYKWVVCIVAFVAATASAAIPSSERAALVELYQSTGGGEWIEKTNWLGAAGTECTWYGVTCNEAGTAVIALELYDNGLTGILPADLGQFMNLQILDLSGNFIGGPLEPIVSLPAIREIWLGDNNITGPIPPEIRRLRALELLVLGYNPIGGPIPKELTELPNLTGVGLWYNELTGEIPIELWQMTTLLDLWLDGNELTGSIPAAVADLRNLEYFSLAQNDLSGPIPIELTTMTNLVQLWLDGNRLEGAIPPEIGQLAGLTHLSLWDNELSGPIPVTLASLKDLQVLALSYNDLTGPIPPELGSLVRLEGLYLGANELSGTVPDSLRGLTNLRDLDLNRANLSGSIPHWIGELSELVQLGLGANGFTGPVPPSIWTLTNLQSLYFGSNRVTGSIPPAVGDLTQLEFLSFHYTSMSGPIPPEIGKLERLQYFIGTRSGLTGPIPPELGNLNELIWVWLEDNHLEGSIPPEIGNLKSLEWLDLGSNRLTGPIPPEIGNLINVRYMNLHENALRGPIPREITLLTNIEDGGGLFIHRNALRIDDPKVADFIERKALFGLDGVQTVTPENVRVAAVTDRSATIAWDEIDHYGPGGYQVVARQTPGGPPVSVATTEYMFDDSIVVRNLIPETTYHFTVSAVTYPSYTQKNVIVSDPSPPLIATTATRVLAPPDVVVTETAKGLIQVDGVPLNEDQFTLTNVGDLPAVITLDIETDFATFAPTQFTLEGGASQVVTVKSIPRPPGYYYGYVWATGEGVLELVGISLFSAAKPEGIVRAEAVDSRVDIAGEPGSDSVGQARFRNIGTAMLSGILVSDQPWVVPDDSRVFISPGSVGSVTFQIVRSRRPPDAEGALVANLSLIYVDGATSFGKSALGSPAAGVSVSKVTIVDVSRPATAAATIPPGLSGVAYFLPGISAFQRDETSFFSDVSVLNNSTGSPASDVRLYYTAAATGLTTVATLSPIPATNSITLANILTTVYQSSSGSGSLQVRTPDWGGIVVQAKLLGLSESGSVAGEVPVFRSDRSLSSGQQLYLAGLRSRSEIYLQETTGAAARVTIRYLDAAGDLLHATPEMTLEGWRVAEITGGVPAGAVTAVVRNEGPGAIAAYARVFDDTSGDPWSVVDWSRVHAYPLGETLRIPFVGAAAEPPGRGRRRVVAHGAGDASTTDLALFNPSDADVAATIEIFHSNGTLKSREEVVIGPGRTQSLTIAGAQAVVTPFQRGQLVVTARGARTAVPVIPAASGLRLGRSQIFSSLEDSTEATVAAAIPGTFRTTLGLVETAGSPAVVRARIYLDEGRGLASSIIYRDFTLNPGQQLMVENLVRSIVGPSRETRLGELHNLQLRLEVISGSGAVVPFVITTDNATGDALLRLD